MTAVSRHITPRGVVVHLSHGPGLVAVLTPDQANDLADELIEAAADRRCALQNQQGGPACVEPVEEPGTLCGEHAMSPASGLDAYREQVQRYAVRLAEVTRTPLRADS